MKRLKLIRNMGIIAHIDAGKTTTSERFIYYSGREHRHGDVDSGNTVTDFDKEEAERGITIYSATTTIVWRNVTVNIIDTPGHVDFTAEVQRVLRVLDGAICVLDGVAGVQAQTETVWRQASTYNVPRLLFVNKLDRAGASYESALDTVRDKLGGQPVPITVPDVSGTGFERVLDYLAGEWLTFDPADDGKTVERVAAVGADLERVRVGRATMVEILADNYSSEQVDALIEMHLEGETIDVALLREALRAATLTGAILPTYAGSSLRNKGVQPLLDGVVDFLPSPLDRPPEPGIHPKTEVEDVRAPDPRAPFAALAFKTVSQTTVDNTFLRVYSGTLKGRVQVLNPGQKKTERIGPKFYRMHGKSLEEIPELRAGDIAVLPGLRWTVTGDTLCDRDRPILFEAIGFPETVISMTIEPFSTAERGNLDKALGKLLRDDPTFRLNEDVETGELVVAGMGELHLEIIKNRLRRDFRVEARFGRPRVSYRETLTGKIRVDHEFEQIVGEDKRLYALIQLCVEADPGSKCVSVDYDPGLSEALVPADVRVAITDAILSRAAGGHLLGYPMIDLRVTVTAGGTDGAAASEATWSAVASHALGKAAEQLSAQGKAVLLEPIMKLEVLVPEQFLGNVINDLGSRRAEITDMAGDESGRSITGKAPLSSMFEYSTHLRSMTQGMAEYAMEPLEYAPVPPDVQKRMMGDL